MSEDILTAFMETRYPTELVQELFKSLNIYDYFNYEEGYTVLDEIMAEVSLLDPDSIADALYTRIVEGLDHLLQLNGLRLNETATLTDKNNVLYAIILFQHREDYEPYARMLETFDDDALKFARIVEDLTSMRETDVLLIIDDIDPKLTLAMGEYIEDRVTENLAYSELEASIVNRIKLYTKLVGEDNLAKQLLDNGFLIGANLETYLSYIGENLVDMNDQQTAANFLGILYLSQDYHDDPIEGYRAVAEDYLDNLSRMSVVESHIQALISKVQELIGADNASRRLS